MVNITSLICGNTHEILNALFLFYIRVKVLDQGITIIVY